MKYRKAVTGKIGAILTLMLAILLSGCGKTDGESRSPVTEEASEEDEKSAEDESRNDTADNLADDTAAKSDFPTETEENLPEGGGDPEKKESGGSPPAEEGGDWPVPDSTGPPEGQELILASEDWGLGFGEDGSQPAGNAPACELAWYDAYYVGEEDEKVIYLTFDCGYENGNTEPILDALKKHNVPATFFVVGHFLETAPEMVKRMVSEGHAVGNHTYHHPDMSSISEKEAFQKELDDVAGLFEEITGTELAPYYRPPQGKCNVHNMEMARELGYFTFFWSLAYVDWNQDSQPEREEALDKLTRRIHPGAIVLLHNTSRTNGEILDELLTVWEEMGYCFRPLSELPDS